VNLFYLDEDLDKLAEYHVDSHIGKMQIEATQLLSTALWIDKLLGFIPRALTSEELAIVKDEMRSLPSNIEDRRHMDIVYKACHQNHPSAIWVRSSLEHFYWTINYVNALESESRYRGRNPHASCRECNRLPMPEHMQDTGMVPPYPAMPDELKSGNTVDDYRLFYMLDKATFAKWSHREKPYWWNEDVALYDKRYTDMTPAERRATGYLK
jgi:hypothetical protein